MVMARRNQNQALLLTLVLGQLVVASLSAPPPPSRPLDLSEWVNQPANAGKDDTGCTRKDPALVAAEAHRVNRLVDPDTVLDPEDGCYKTIGEAIASIPDGSTKRYVLTLKPGVVFREKVFLNRSKPFVTIMSGDARNPATIVWNDTAATPGKDDGKPLGVDGSSTVAVESDYFIAYGVVIKNDAAASAKAGEAAPALRVTGTKATFYNCTVDGGHGALYDQRGLHYFKSSTIMGTIDFIFGAAKSLFEGCNIVSTAKEEAANVAKVPHRPGNAMDANAIPGEVGFSFKTCTVKGAGPQVYLGRVAWPYIFSYTNIEKELVPLIYDDRGNIQTPDERGTYYADFKCFGSGHESSPTFRMQYDQAKSFTGTHFVSGDSWILSLPPPEE